MSPGKTEKTGSPEALKKDILAKIDDILRELVTIATMAFLFITFAVQTFIIPTGSMAATLRGAHFRLCCPQCGYRYDRGFVSQEYNLAEGVIPGINVKPPLSRCPNCGYYHWTNDRMPITRGEKILVLKCIYQFVEPKRWDVTVFKNPLEPSVNYIKRLVGLPTEEVEIIDGDVYINGKICRKPPKVQEELWMPVYNNDYQPVRPWQGSFNGHIWEQPFKNITGAEWTLNDKDGPTIFRLESSSGKIHSFFYDTSVGNDFRATYAYNDVREYAYMPNCSDLMVRFYADLGLEQGQLGIELSKYETQYKAWIDIGKLKMFISKVSDGKETVLEDGISIRLPVLNKPTLVEFANVDHLLTFQFGKEKLTYDLGRGPDDAGQRKTEIQPRVRIFGSGELTLSRIAIFRDIYYTAQKPAGGPEKGRATEGSPFPLAKDEFFALGDNSPDSLDCRWWSEPGKANHGLSYRAGIVPREYIVGKAFFVFWPGGFKPFDKFPFAVIPDVGHMRFIYGGSKNYSLNSETVFNTH